MSLSISAVCLVGLTYSLVECSSDEDASWIAAANARFSVTSVWSHTHRFVMYVAECRRFDVGLSRRVGEAVRLHGCVYIVPLGVTSFKKFSTDSLRRNVIKYTN